MLDPGCPSLKWARSPLKVPILKPTEFDELVSPLSLLIFGDQGKGVCARVVDQSLRPPVVASTGGFNLATPKVNLLNPKGSVGEGIC